MLTTLIVVGAVIVLILFLISASIKVVPEYMRGVIFRLGRLIGAKGPGLFILIPIVDKMVKVDLRTLTMEVPPQEIITKDNVPAKVSAVSYFRVVDPNKAIVQVENYVMATSQIAQTTLRSVLGQADLDHLLTERDKINARLQEIIDEQTEPWGVKVSTVEIKDVEIPQGMQRAMARQAEAERERRAKVIAAEGEFQASEKLAGAAQVLDRTPTAIQLRYLQTLVEIAAEKNSTTIFPLPIDLIEPFLRGMHRSYEPAGPPPVAAAPAAVPAAPEPTPPAPGAAGGSGDSEAV
jgi:regulator of protease activity HflC (stomatin/prohibitin superfamily)